TWLYPTRTQKDPVKVTVQRPADGKTWTVELTPTQLPQWGGPAPTSATLLPGGVVKIPVPGFTPDIAKQVIKAIDDIRKTDAVRGVVLDLRGNHGGDPAEVGRLLGAFVHDKVWGHSCDVKDRCRPEYRTDDTVPLLNLPLVVLTDGQTVSAGDAFAMAVKDFGIGKLVGTRTAGIASGDTHGYLLNDNNTLINMPSKHIIGANGEIFAGIGVPPDHHVPLTPADISAGRDPGTDKAVQLLTS
ncbi:S41 family peptidase, partial [Streptomyces sp. NPDC059835]|uniref:S41 family peptidase n=1 Tax=Streptomyces sp. NPDC059835 TaxID=3346967 RepID=UPI003656B2FD